MPYPVTLFSFFSALNWIIFSLVHCDWLLVEKLLLIPKLCGSVRFPLMLFQVTAFQISIWIMHQACRLVSKRGGSVLNKMVLSDVNRDLFSSIILGCVN